MSTAKECSVAECVRPVEARTLCRLHYYRWYRTGQVELVRKRKLCTAEGCTDGVHTENLCQSHLYRWRKYGDVFGVQLVVPDGPVRLPLRDKDGNEVAHTTVDGIDSLWLDQWRWSLNPSGYAYRVGEGTTILLHRVLLGLLNAGPMFQADHINRDRLDNRRQNLRVVTAAVNNLNKGAA